MQTSAYTFSLQRKWGRSYGVKFRMRKPVSTQAAANTPLAIFIIITVIIAIVRWTWLTSVSHEVFFLFYAFQQSCSATTAFSRSGVILRIVRAKCGLFIFHFMGWTIFFHLSIITREFEIHNAAMRQYKNVCWIKVHIVNCDVSDFIENYIVCYKIATARDKCTFQEWEQSLLKLKW